MTTSGSSPTTSPSAAAPRGAGGAGGDGAPRELTRADYCVIGCAEAFRDNGEVLASAFGTIPVIGARLARVTFAPDLLLSDGEASLVTGEWAVGAPAPGPVEAYVPFRAIFDLLASGRRHVMMIPSQLDTYGNANISAIGDFARPKVQLLGVRGAPGNSVNHPTSYWVARHSPRVFVDHVDVVCGVGTDRVPAGSFVDLRRVVTDLGVFAFDGPVGARGGATLRAVSLHPGVSAADVVAASGQCPVSVPDDVPVTRDPTADELDLIDRVLDPRGLRHREVPPT